MSSWTYDGNCISKLWMCQSTNFEIISVGHPLPLMIGLVKFVGRVRIEPFIIRCIAELPSAFRHIISGV